MRLIRYGLAVRTSGTHFGGKLGRCVPDSGTHNTRAYRDARPNDRTGTAGVRRNHVQEQERIDEGVTRRSLIVAVSPTTDATNERTPMADDRHNVTRFADERGYRGLCGCGWRVTRRTREAREQAAHEHETEQTLSVRRVASEPGGAG